MAKQIITMMTDDLVGGEADTTVEFAIDGVGYSIDLNEENAGKLRELLAPYQQAGTRTGRVASGGYAPGSTVRPRVTVGNREAMRENRQLNNQIRVWAQKNGYDLAERGRIPQHVVNAYHRGTPNPGAVQEQVDVIAAPVAEPVAEPTAKTPRKAAPAKKTTARRARATAS